MSAPSASEHDEPLATQRAPAGEDQLDKTGEGSALDFLDVTIAKRPGDPTRVAPEEAARAAAAAEEDVIIADDLAEIIEVDDEAGGEPDEKPAPKRSVPPPIPRS
jgi:hypothetical protein